MKDYYVDPQEMDGFVEEAIRNAKRFWKGGDYMTITFTKIGDTKNGKTRFDAADGQDVSGSLYFAPGEAPDVDEFEVEAPSA